MVNRIQTTKIYIILTLSLLLSNTIMGQERGEFKKKRLRNRLVSEQIAKVLPTFTGKAKILADEGLTEVLNQGLYDGVWEDEFKTSYSYSEDRLTITMDSYIFDDETDEWVQDGTVVTSFNTDGLPVYTTSVSDLLEEDRRTDFYYGEDSRIDSAIYNGEEEGEPYVEKTYFDYVTEDSIAISGFYSDSEGSFDYDGDYMLESDGNLIEVYFYDDEAEKYTTYSMDLELYLKTVFNEFLFYDMLYEVKHSLEEQFVPSSRTTVQYDNGKVSRLLDEEYSDGSGWEPEYRYDYVYEGDSDVIRQEDEYYFYDSWELEYRSLYTYSHEVSNENSDEVADFALNQNYPNPFNPNTTISYQLPEVTKVRLSVFDILGREVAVLVNGIQSVGEHQFNFDASNLPSGMYVYQLRTESMLQTRQMMLIK